MSSYNSLDTSLLNKRPAPTFMPHNMAQNYHQNQAMNFPYNNFSMQQYHAGYFREDQNKSYNTTTTQDPDEFLSEPTKKIKSEKNSEYSYPNGNPTFPYSQINNSQASNQNNQLKATMQNMMYQNQNFQDHLTSTNHKTWENAASGINSADQKSMTVEKPAPKPETNPTAFSGEGQMAAFQQNSMMQNQYAQAMMAKYYSSMQNSAQAAQYKLYMQQQQQKYMNSNPYMNMTQAQQAQLYWAQQMKNMNAQRQAYQNLANSGNAVSNNSTENYNSTQPQVQVQQPQVQAQAQALNNRSQNDVMQFFKDQNKSQEVESKPQPQPQPQAQIQMRNTNMADLAAKGIHININTVSSKSEKQSNKNAPEEPEYKNSKNHLADFPSEEDKTTMISPTSFQVQDTNKIEGTAPAPIFDDIYFDINMANLDKFFDADGLGDFNVQDVKKDDDKKAQPPVVVKKGRGRPRKEEQSQEAKNNKESKKEVKDVQEPKEKKVNKKKAKEEKKEEQAFTMADSFFNQANQMPFKQAGGAQGFLENQFEMESFPPQNVNVPKAPQKDSKEKISLLENNNSMNSLVKEQHEYTNSNSISMMYPIYQYQHQQQQQNDLFENFEFDFQDTEEFDFEEGTFLFEPFDESRQGEEFESTTEATSQPVRKRGRPRKYAPDGSLLVPDGSGYQPRQPINKKASRLQAEREAYEKYLEELKKPYVIHIHHNEDDPEQKVNHTRVGEDHQLYVPQFVGNQAPAKKKNLSPLWAPDMATQEFLDSYLRRLEAVVGQKIAHQGAALRVLKIYNMRVDDVLENVKISPKYYQNYFKVNQRSAKNRFNH
jgi:hypothetical protein